MPIAGRIQGVPDNPGGQYDFSRMSERLCSVEDCICDGTDDKGIDAICVNETLAQIDIFQSRMAKF
jgi:hypothetical protein